MPEKATAARQDGQSALLTQILEALGGEDPNVQTVTSTVAVAVDTSADELAAANAARKTLIVQNPTASAVSLFVNATNGVTAANGMEVPPGGYVKYEGAEAQDAVHGITASGSVSARVTTVVYS